jgi:hypothetical protein
MEDKPKYVEIEPKSKAELEEAFASGDQTTLCNAMYSAAQYEPDWRWTQGKLLEFLACESVGIRASALIALGELALFQGRVDVEIVLPEVYKLANDPALAPYVEDCVGDIKSRITIN